MEFRASCCWSCKTSWHPHPPKKSGSNRPTVVLERCNCSQGSKLGRLLFLIYINHLSVGLKSNPKLFVDDTSLFSITKDTNLPQIDLNEDLAKINNWAYQLKINFTVDPSSKDKKRFLVKNAPRFYGQPKIHKPGVPIPTVSYSSSSLS